MPHIHKYNHKKVVLPPSRVWRGKDVTVYDQVRHYCECGKSKLEKKKKRT